MYQGRYQETSFFAGNRGKYSGKSHGLADAEFVKEVQDARMISDSSSPFFLRRVLSHAFFVIVLWLAADAARAEPLTIQRALALRSQMTREQFQAQQEAKLRAGAKMYEQYFLQDMVKAMRRTVTPGYTQPSYGERIYREQLDTRYVEAWANKGGVGLADVIYNQLHQRYFPKREIRPLGMRSLRRPPQPLPIESSAPVTKSKF